MRCNDDIGSLNGIKLADAVQFLHPDRGESVGLKCGLQLGFIA